MKIYLPSREVRKANARAAAQRNAEALRNWHPKFKVAARVNEEDVRLFETVQRRLTDTGTWEYRPVLAG